MGKDIINGRGRGLMITKINVKHTLLHCCTILQTLKCIRKLASIAPSLWCLNPLMLHVVKLFMTKHSNYCDTSSASSHKASICAWLYTYVSHSLNSSSIWFDHDQKKGVLLQQGTHACNYGFLI